MTFNGNEIFVCASRYAASDLTFCDIDCNDFRERVKKEQAAKLDHLIGLNVFILYLHNQVSNFVLRAIFLSARTP